MAKRKPIDLSQLRRSDAQADGLGTEGNLFSEMDTHVGQGPAGAHTSRRLEVLPLSMIFPDRFQPRPLLPLGIRERFFAGNITCYEAAREWLAMAEQDAGLQERVTTLVRMGHTFETHGQIKPITGAWQEIGGERLFVIETGERRFWAAALVAVQNNAPREPMLQVLPVATPARERQVIENQHAEPPSAVGRAREVAALLLEAAQVYPNAAIVDDYDYFREVLGLRHKMETWRQLEEIMGITRPHMTRLIKLLNLPTALLEQADRYQVPERILREILDLPLEQRDGALRTMIAQGGTHEDVPTWQERAAEKPTPPDRPVQEVEPAHRAARKLKAIFRTLQRDVLDSDPVGALAGWLAYEIHDPEDLSHAADTLEDLANQIRARLWKK